MITREENHRLTRVEGDAPMGRLMRENYWIPFALSSQLKPGDAPFQSHLLGEHYVAFRAEDGRVGFFEELCPHRRASLALGRVEGNGIRCIFHGWKMDVSGRVVEAPTQLIEAEKFCARVRVSHFPVHEAGGLAWVWLGKAETQSPQSPQTPKAQAPQTLDAQAPHSPETQSPHTLEESQQRPGLPPPFPELPFAGAHESNTWLSVSQVPCNWLQGVEAALDSAHVGVLHKSWLRDFAELKSVPNIRMALDEAPRYETEAAPYGLRAAALRRRDDGRTYARVSEYFMPFVALIPADRPAPNEGYLFIIAPVDDTRHLLFWGYYSERRRKPPHEIGLAARDHIGDINNFVQVMGSGGRAANMDGRAAGAGGGTGRMDGRGAGMDGGRAKRWGQDRELMKGGHFSGFARTLIEEDVVVQASMGPIVDRENENISSTDVAVLQARRMLQKALEDAGRSVLPPGSALGGEPVRVANPLDTLLEPGAPWGFDSGRAVV